MTQEKKDLLLKDLCARLPYGVICEGKYSDAEYDIDGGIEMFDVYGVLEGICNEDAVINSYYCDIETVKPYLRPIDSMTDEEIYEWNIMVDNCRDEFDSCFVDYCNRNHLDYRDLIPKGLALEAPKDMYKF